MPLFRVFVEGRNFLIDGPDGRNKCGFYATRFVEAANPEAAELAAIAKLRAQPSLKEMVLNPRDDSPMLYALEIEEVDNIPAGRAEDTGAVWYSGDDEAPPK